MLARGDDIIRAIRQRSRERISVMVKAGVGDDACETGKLCGVYCVIAGWGVKGKQLLARGVTDIGEEVVESLWGG